MSDALQYKGYRGRVEFSSGDDCFHGVVTNIKDTVTFEGKSVTDLKRAFKESVDYYLELCRKRGEEPEKPYSGRLLIRVSQELHRRLALAAEREGTSVNAFVTRTLTQATTRR